MCNRRTLCSIPDFADNAFGFHRKRILQTWYEVRLAEARDKKTQWTWLLSSTLVFLFSGNPPVDA